MTNSYRIRVMTRKELDLAVEWAATEGWNPGLQDADCFYSADPEGFLLGEYDGEPVAAISAVRYGKRFGFLGFYLVRPEYRGRGYGIGIWNAAMTFLEGRIVGLDGVVDQQDNYQRSGFRLAYRNIRYQGIGGATEDPGKEIVVLSERPFDEVRDYDQPFFPGPREAFLKSWITQAGGVALGVVRSGQLTGYGVLRACRSGYKIGPLFADTPGDAERLLLAFKARVPSGEALFLDIPEVNPEACALVERHRMQKVFETARMYRGDAPSLPLKRIYGVTTFELG